MGHLLETGNPEAAQAIKDANPAPEPLQQEPVAALEHPPTDRAIGLMPLPEVGDMVLYHPRGSEVRRGRKIVPALVTWRDEDKRELELCLIHEANDVRQQERVREWPGGDERGWESKGGRLTVNRVGVEESALEALSAEVAELRKIVLGEFETPPASIMDMLDDIDQRVDALKPAVAAKPVAKPAAKKKASKGK